MRLLLLLVLSSGLLTGCATFSDQELAQIRSRGISREVLHKLDRDLPLTPGEIIHLEQRGVADSVILRHLDSAGLNYIPTRADVLRMRRGGVSARVIDEVIAEGDRFAADYSRPQHVITYGVGFGSPYYGYSDPWYGGW